MPETVEVIEELGIIKITSVGHITEHDLRISRMMVRNICQQRGLTKILVDATGQTNRMSVMAAYDHASILAKDVYLKRAKHAIISPEHPENSLGFLETAAINRGASVRLFPTREHALSWLIE